MFYLCHSLNLSHAGCIHPATNTHTHTHTTHTHTHTTHTQNRNQKTGGEHTHTHTHTHTPLAAPARLGSQIFNQGGGGCGGLPLEDVTSTSDNDLASVTSMTCCGHSNLNFHSPARHKGTQTCINSCS